MILLRRVSQKLLGDHIGQRSRSYSLGHLIVPSSAMNGRSSHGCDDGPPLFLC